MSVLKNKRSVSSLEFYHNAIMLRREITMLLLRDFGIKDKVRSVKSLYGVPGMEPVDAQKYIRYVEMIEKEIALLKGWRKSDNKILKKIRENEAAKAQKEGASQKAEKQV